MTPADTRRSETLRAFVGFKVPCGPRLRRVLSDLRLQRPAVRPVQAEQLHITLKFLGDIALHSVDGITQALISATGHARGFSATMTGLGCFPQRERPSVLWVGLSPCEECVRLAEIVERALEPLGYPREPRPFAPHVTLARIRGRPPQPFHELLARHAATAFGSVELEAIQLYRSDRAAQGSRYTVLADAPLSECQ